jgi:3-oxoacyl-[acyl-carrier protein] reductase
VNTVSPGQMDTSLFRGANKTTGIMDSIVRQNSSRKLGGPEDIAPLVAFLASEAAQWINGQNIQVDGVSTPKKLYNSRMRELGY